MLKKRNKNDKDLNVPCPHVQTENDFLKILSSETAFKYQIMAKRHRKPVFTQILVQMRTGPKFTFSVSSVDTRIAAYAFIGVDLASLIFLI